MSEEKPESFTRIAGRVEAADRILRQMERGVRRTTRNLDALNLAHAVAIGANSSDVALLDAARRVALQTVVDAAQGYMTAVQVHTKAVAALNARTAETRAEVAARLEP